MRRWLFVAGRVLGGGSLLAILALVLLLETEAGASWMLKRAGGEAFQVGSVEGRILGSLTLHDLRYTAPGYALAIDRLRVNWRPAALLRGLVEIRHLEVQGLGVETRDAPPGDPFAVRDLRLPLAVQLGASRITDLSFGEVSDAEGFQASLVGLAASSRRGEWVLDSLVVTGFQGKGFNLDLTLQAELTSLGEYPLSVSGSWAGELLRDENRPSLPLAGEFSVEGSLAQMQVSHSLGAPFSATLSGQVREVLSEARWDAELLVPSFLFSALEPDAPQHAFEGQLSAVGIATEMEAHGTLRLALEDGGAYRGELALSRAGSTWSLDSLLVDAMTGSGHAGFRGTVELAGEQPTGWLDARWRDFTWPKQWAPEADSRGFGSRDGRLSLEGGLDSLQFDLSADLKPGRAPEGRWDVAGIGRFGDGRSGLRASFRASLDEVPEIHGDISGSLAGTRIDLESLTMGFVGKMASLELGGWADVGREVRRGRARASWRHLDWPLQGEASLRSPEGSLDLDGGVEGFVLGVDAALEGDGLPLSDWRLDGTASFSDETLRGDAVFLGSFQDSTLGSFEGVAQVTRSPDRLSLDSLVLLELTSGARLTLEGAMEKEGSDGEGWVRGSWEDLAWPLTGPAAYQSPLGNLWVGGKPDAYQVEFDLEVGGTTIPEGRWGGQGAGSGRELRLDSLWARTLGGELGGSLTVGSDSVLSWSLDVAAEDLDPGILRPEWPGRLALRLHSGGALRQGKMEGELNVRELGGELRGRPFLAGLDLERDESGFRLDTLFLLSESSRVEAAGGLSDRWNLRWRIQAPELSDLVPGLEGTVNSSGSVTGPRGDPRVLASLEGERIAAKGARISEAWAEVDVDLSNLSPSMIEGRIEGLSSAGLAIDSVSLSVNGLSSDHGILLNAQGGDGGLAARLQGEWSRGGWMGQLVGLDLESTRAGRWALEESSLMRVARDSSSMGPTCWAASTASGRLCLTGQWERQGGASWDLTGTSIPLAFLDPLLPQGMEITGTADLAVAGSTAPDRMVSASGQAEGSGGSFRYQLDSSEWQERVYEGFRLFGVTENGEVLGEGALTLSGSSELSGRFGSRPLPDGGKGLSGSLTGELSDDGFLGAVVDDLSGTSGRVILDLNLAGSQSAPALSGSVEVREGNAYVPFLGIQVREFGFRARSDQAGDWGFAGEVGSGTGDLQWTGEVTLPNPDQPWSGTLNLAGRDFEIYNSALGRVDASPELAVRATPGGVEAEGTVRIPRADITAQSLELVVPPSSDVVIIGGPASPEESGPLPATRASARIRLELGDEVRIDALGIQGRLRGNLLVTSDPRQPPVGSGELLLEDGRYSAYRQVFEIEQGKLIFAAGPLDDPGLDLRIVRRHPDVTAGMNIAGTAKSPRISLFSDPSYGDDEILSYLLLGRPLNRLDQAEGSMVHTVAKALGLAGGQFIVTRLGAIFGVEEARIEGGSRPAETALVLGKQVLPRVKVDYSIGLLGAPNTLRIRYEVGRGWLLQTESGAEAGADLIYTFKKGPGGGG